MVASSAPLSQPQKCRDVRSRPGGQPCCSPICGGCRFGRVSSPDFHPTLPGWRRGSARWLPVRTWVVVGSDTPGPRLKVSRRSESALPLAHPRWLPVRRWVVAGSDTPGPLSESVAMFGVGPAARPPAVVAGSDMGGCRFGHPDKQPFGTVFHLFYALSAMEDPPLHMRLPADFCHVPALSPRPLPQGTASIYCIVCLGSRGKNRRRARDRNTHQDRMVGSQSRHAAGILRRWSGEWTRAKIRR